MKTITGANFMLSGKFLLVPIMLALVAVPAVVFLAVGSLLAPTVSIYLNGTPLSPDEPGGVGLFPNSECRVILYIEASTTYAWIELTIEHFSEELLLVDYDGKMIKTPHSWSSKVAELHRYPFTGFIIVAPDQSGNYEIDLSMTISRFFFSRKHSCKIVVAVEPTYVKPYGYEFLLSGSAIYTFRHENRIWIDTTTLDYFITNEVGVEPVGISGTYGLTYIEVEIHMPKAVDEETLDGIVRRVISEEYSLTVAERFNWSIYMKEERKYPIVDLDGLQKFIKSEMVLSPTGVLTEGVKINIYMPQEVDSAKLEAIVNKFIEQGGVTWSSEREREKTFLDG